MGAEWGAEWRAAGGCAASGVRAKRAAEIAERMGRFMGPPFRVAEAGGVGRLADWWRLVLAACWI